MCTESPQCPPSMREVTAVWQRMSLARHIRWPTWLSVDRREGVGVLSWLFCWWYSWLVSEFYQWGGERKKGMEEGREDGREEGREEGTKWTVIV